MASRSAVKTVTNAAWVLLFSGTGAYIENKNVNASYYIRVFDSGDSAPTTAIDTNEDISLFKSFDEEQNNQELLFQSTHDVYARAYKESGVLVVLT